MKNKHFDTCQKQAVKMDTDFVPIVRVEKFIKYLINAIVVNDAINVSAFLQIAGTVS